MVTNLNLQPNEGIIIQYDGVWHNNTRSELFLTNLNLICVEDRSGLFKTKYNVIKYPVNQIKVVNGQAQASVIRDGDKWVLQILFKNGEEQFSFNFDFFEKSKKKAEADKWVEQINILLTGASAQNIIEPSIIGGLKNILKAVGIKTTEKEIEKATKKCMGCMAPISGIKGQTIFCRYCDTKQIL